LSIKHNYKYLTQGTGQPRKNLNAMLSTNVFEIKFRYLHQLFRASVTKADYPEGCTVYKLIFKAAKYWFIRYNNEWKIVSDLQIHSPLKTKIIQLLEQHSSPA
jgi:hypothetical protein